MKLLLLAPLLLASAWAQPPAPYDIPGPVPTADVVPPALLSPGPGEVAAEAMADGLLVTFSLTGPQGVEQITGVQMLANRLRELRAIEALREMNKSEEFGKAILKAGGEKIDSVKSAIKDPVGTVQKLPKGASKFFGNIGNAVKGVADGKIGPTAAVEGALGVQRKKAELALRLGVSPFSRDPVLQQELNNAARAMAGGATLLNFAGLFIDGGVGTAISVVNLNQNFQDALIRSTPEELAARNRNILQGLGADPESVRGFLGNPAFSPWQRSAVAQSLQEIGLNPDPLLQQAVGATSDEDALYFVQLARLFRDQHVNRSALTGFRSINGIPCATDANGTLVVAVAADLIEWTPSIEARAGEFVAVPQRDSTIKSIMLVTDGMVSARATSALQALGIPVVTQALEGGKS